MQPRRLDHERRAVVGGVSPAPNLKLCENGIDLVNVFRRERDICRFGVLAHALAVG